MIKIGVILLAISIYFAYTGQVVTCFLGLFGGFYLISTHRADKSIRISYKNIMDPVDDTLEASAMAKAARVVAYLALACAIGAAVAKYM